MSSISKLIGMGVHGLLAVYVINVIRCYKEYRTTKTTLEVALAIPDRDSRIEVGRFDRAKKDLSIAIFPFPRLYRIICRNWRRLRK
jgi:hypothetical protein